MFEFLIFLFVVVYGNECEKISLEKLFLPNVSLVMVNMHQLKFDLAVGINACAQHRGFYNILSLSHNKLRVFYFGLSC